MRARIEPGVVAGGWWEKLEDGRVRCDRCPRRCTLHAGQRGFCFVRQERDGAIVLTSYGQGSGLCVDPIEKKPLSHFHPGTSVLSFGTIGCNLGCKFCQNWDISKTREMARAHEHATPEQIATLARELGCRSVAFTYNDPVTWAEYAIDSAHAARELGLATVAVTAGYVDPKAREQFFRAMDAANVDLKAFTEDFYKRVCAARRAPVLETIEWLHRETSVWLELTTLLIPGHNDSDAEIEQLASWVLDRLGPDVPLHFTAFHPDFRMEDVPPTPPETLRRARARARSLGLHHVYTGNVRDEEGAATLCASCGARVIAREGYRVREYALDARGACTSCGAVLAGRFDSTPREVVQRRRVSLVT
ncbi:AmmeMemoRadiSam system radical SAM enzyme [Sandaracinus amylolyticus]|uniref:AmmeMemoRadiSam system radical SAM enzyme n=1 Tax=Sandaracinus amylolyticus TaxID=927083 RepID=UPI00069F6B17|nr:AmmeMemoRadiSam system radical SAM enzyme [Sandaracinus amylolyticus]